MSPAGVILAAGASSRMGRPKALLQYQGETFLDRWIRLFSNVCQPVIVVLGYDADRIRLGVQRSADAIFVLNPEPSRGMLSSLQTAMRSVPAAAERVVFTLVDHPQVSSATIAAVAEARALVAIPVFGGERGHPVSIARSVMEEILQLPPESSPQDVMRRHRNETLFLEVGDPGVLADVDDPAAYAALSPQKLQQ